MKTVACAIQNVIFGLALILFSCNPRYYIPTTQNVPMIQAKGQTNLTGSGNGNQFESHVAYGIADQLAVQLSGGFIAPKEEDNGNGGSGKFIEAGLGYYKKLNSDFLFDTYCLFGLGNMENHFPTTVADNPTTSGKIKANMLRFGLQPCISYQQKYFSISGSARILSLNYSNIEGSLIFDKEDQIKYLNDAKSNFIIEPALTVRAGLEKIKFQMQLMKSFNLSHTSFKQDDDLITFGLNFNFY